MSGVRKVFLGIALLAVVGVVVRFASTILFNPFDFGACDGEGPANGTRRELYANGKPKWEGTVKDCLWEGPVTRYYEAGGVESRSGYHAGAKHGPAVYFTPEGHAFKRETYAAGELIDFEIQDAEAGALFTFKDDTLKRMSAEGVRSMAFAQPLSMRGFDDPFVSLYGHKLVLRGAQDYYLIGPDLGIELDLCDTLLKYIPSAYEEKVDVSGNRFTFLWHRSITDSTLVVTVYYDADQHQSNQKTWVCRYPI